jgi:hypothetical protein
MSSWLANLTGVHISPKKAYVDKKQLKRAALTAGGLALGGVAGGLVGKLGGKLLGDGAGQMAGDAIEGLGGGDIAGPSRFRRIAGFLGGKDGFGGDDLLKYGQAAGDAYGAYQGAKDQDRYRRLADQNYAANEPLRAKARQMLLEADQRPDLSHLFADPGNPRYRPVGGR